MADKYNSSFITNYLYNRLPEMYRTEDNNLLLKRFMSVFSEGGYTPVLNETANIMDLLDVDKCPSEFLPMLCSLYGYEYSLDIPELFQRRLLKYIVEMYKRKGTKSVVKYIARELTGFDSEIIENKDFTPEQEQITTWSVGLQNYRNFILKLTAPYEDSQLYNKEDIVVKIVKDFLPTNSQVLVITAYWFKEESQVIKKALEGIYDIVNDYNNEMFLNTIEESVPHESITGETFSFNWMAVGEEESYLNYPVAGIPLFTNAIAFMRDTVKFNMESYEITRDYLETETKYKLNQNDNVENFVGSSVYTDSTRQQDMSHTESKDYYNNYTNTDTSRLAIEEEITSLDKDSLLRNFSKVLDNLDDISYLIGRIMETNYDIMGIAENDNSNLTAELNTNILLNRDSGLYTNGLFMFDIVKEANKPDRLILL